MPMDFKSAGRKVRALVAAKKPSELSRSALHPDPLRDNVISEEAQRVQRFRTQANDEPTINFQHPEKGEQSYQWREFGESMRDVARAQYGYQRPRVLPADQVAPQGQLGRDIMANFIGSEHFDESWPYTSGNSLESLFAAMAAGHTLQEMAGEQLAEHIARSEEMGEAADEQTAAENAMDKLRELAKQENQEHGTVQKGTRQQIKKAMQAQQQAQAKLQGALEQYLAGGAKKAASAAGRAMAEAAADAAQIASMIGSGDDVGNTKQLSPDEQLALAEQWAANPNLRELAKHIGRALRDMRFKRQTRTKNVAVEPVSVTTGRELERMLPHELARAYMPEFRGVWLKDYSERSLLEWQMHGKEPAGKGAVVAVVDGSGSMTMALGDTGITKFVWASGLQMALLAVAHREKRSFAAVEFGSRGEVKTWIFPKDEPIDPHRVLDMASHMFAGGTHTVGGLREAMNVIEGEGEFKKADVVLVGDGIDPWRQPDVDMRDEFAKKNVRVHGISIETGTNHYFDQMCDWHVDVADLASADVATTKLAQNIN